MEEERYDKKYIIYRDDVKIEDLYRDMEKEKLMEDLRKIKSTAITEEVKPTIIKEKPSLHVTPVRFEDEEELKPLRLKVEEVMGSVTERKDFLEKRIKELKEALEKREELHKKIMNDIKKDMEDKEALMRKMSKMDEIRDVMVDISTLKSQMRKEEISFWRDTVEIKSELSSLEEELQITSKIASIVEGYGE